MANNPIPALFYGDKSFMINLPASDEFMITGGKSLTAEGASATRTTVDVKNDIGQGRGIAPTILFSQSVMAKKLRKEL